MDTDGVDCECAKEKPKHGYGIEWMAIAVFGILGLQITSSNSPLPTPGMVGRVGLATISRE
jgi:hypothetical protein